LRRESNNVFEVNDRYSNERVLDAPVNLLIEEGRVRAMEKADKVEVRPDTAPVVEASQLGFL